MFRRFTLGLAAFAVAIVLLPAVSALSVAGPYEPVIKACDNENKSKAGSCKKEEKSMGVLYGCAGDACFVCPADGKRQCYPATDSAANKVLKANLDVKLAPTGVNIEAVVKGCDYIHEHGKPCTYTTGSLPVVQIASGGRNFQCVNRKECHTVR